MDREKQFRIWTQILKAVWDNRVYFEADTLLEPMGLDPSQDLLFITVWGVGDISVDSFGKITLSRDDIVQRFDHVTPIINRIKEV